MGDDRVKIENIRYDDKACGEDDRTGSTDFYLSKDADLCERAIFTEQERYFKRSCVNANLKLVALEMYMDENCQKLADGEESKIQFQASDECNGEYDEEEQKMEWSRMSFSYKELCGDEGGRDIEDEFVVTSDEYLGRRCEGEVVKSMQYKVERTLDCQAHPFLPNTFVKLACVGDDNLSVMEYSDDDCMKPNGSQDTLANGKCDPDDEGRNESSKLSFDYDKLCGDDKGGDEMEYKIPLIVTATSWKGQRKCPKNGKGGHVEKFVVETTTDCQKDPEGDGYMKITCEGKGTIAVIDYEDEDCTKAKKEDDIEDNIVSTGKCLTEKEDREWTSMMYTFDYDQICTNEYEKIPVAVEYFPFGTDCKGLLKKDDEVVYNTLGCQRNPFGDHYFKLTCSGNTLKVVDYKDPMCEEEDGNSEVTSGVCRAIGDDEADVIFTFDASETLCKPRKKITCKKIKAAADAEGRTDCTCKIKKKKAKCKPKKVRCIKLDRKECEAEPKCKVSSKKKFKCLDLKN